MELVLEHNIKEKRLAAVEHKGYIVLSPDISETMGLEPGTELMGRKVDGMVILEPYRPRCVICDSVFQTKEVCGKFLCQSCINKAKKKSFYKYEGNFGDE